MVPPMIASLEPVRFLASKPPAQLLSEPPARPAGYPGPVKYLGVISAAISINSLRLVNHFGGQTLPVRRVIQISARGIARNG